jgi:ubiquinone/menaquinone biosynthesis C-methylase UbiE
MSIKSKVKNTYNKSARFWYKSRASTINKFEEKRLLKMNRSHFFIEKPAMYSKVPDLKGKSVLCLGCGSGEECTFLQKKNPLKLIGIDIADKLIEIAKKRYPKIEFFVMDAEHLAFENNSFDFIYSSLILDHFKSWKKVLSEVYRVLKKGGTFLFSNTHPIKWAAERTMDKDGKAIGALLGFQKDQKTGKQKIYGDYLHTVLHHETWMDGMDILFYSKSISQMFKEVTEAGLTVIDMVEPKAIPLTKKFDKDYWEANQKIPNFIIFETKK